MPRSASACRHGKTVKPLARTSVPPALDANGRKSGGRGGGRSAGATLRHCSRRRGGRRWCQEPLLDGHDEPHRRTVVGRGGQVV